MYFSFTKKLKVESKTGPIMAEGARRPAATKSRDGTDSPLGRVTLPTRAPTPMPMDSRKNTGSRNTEMKVIHFPRQATMFRSSRRSGGAIDAPGRSRAHHGRGGM